METGDRPVIFKNKLDEACFEHDMANGGFTDLIRRTQSDIVLKNKALKISGNPKYNGYERGLAIMVYNYKELVIKSWFKRKSGEFFTKFTIS